MGGAEKALKEGLAFNQDNPDYTQQMWGRLGDFYRRNGRDQEALDAWQKSAENLKLRDAPGALLKIGDYWKEKEDYVRALTIFQDIVSRITLKAIPQRLYYRFSAQHGAGLCLRALGRYTEAVELYQQAVKDARDDNERWSAQYSLADTWFEMGEREKATTVYRDLLQQCPVTVSEETKKGIRERLTVFTHSQ
ncbi:MAG: tetratricopeptide repeat protein [Armatimonadetes bacterium]|nr:tetratricopeptide repeat protein [Armatimonadota bacterium]